MTECSSIGNEMRPTVKLSYNTKGDESVDVRIDGEAVRSFIFLFSSVNFVFSSPIFAF